MLGFLAISLFCGWYIKLQCMLCFSGDYKKELGLTIFMFLFRISWAVFLIIYSFINMINEY